jgi:hypothetical protein
LFTLYAPIKGRSTIRMNRNTSPRAIEIPETISRLVRVRGKLSWA